MRPAVVVSQLLTGDDFSLFWSVMITSAANKGWADDLSLEERYEECGLRIPCVIRTAKIASLEVASASKVGRLPDDLLVELRARLTEHLGL